MFFMGFADWDESKHPRHGSGSDKGGEFAPAGGGEHGGVSSDKIKSALGEGISSVKVEGRGPKGKATWITVTMKKDSPLAKSSTQLETMKSKIEKATGKTLKTGRIGESVGDFLYFDWIAR